MFFLEYKRKRLETTIRAGEETLVAVSVLPVFITVFNTNNNLPYCAYYQIKITMFFIKAFKGLDHLGVIPCSFNT